jgi:Leucine-rich repeat (LRR) protein
MVRVQEEMEFRENNRTEMERAIDRIEMERLKAERVDRDYQQLQNIEQDILQQNKPNKSISDNQNNNQQQQRHEETKQEVQSGTDHEDVIQQRLRHVEGTVLQKLGRTSVNSHEELLTPGSHSIVPQEIENSNSSEQQQSPNQNRPQSILQTLTNRALDSVVGPPLDSSSNHDQSRAEDAHSHSNSNSRRQRRPEQRVEEAFRPAADLSYISLGKRKNGQPYLKLKRNHFKCIVALSIALVLVIIIAICLLLTLEESPFVDDNLPSDIYGAQGPLERMEQSLFLETRQAILDPATLQARAMAWMEQDMIIQTNTDYSQWRLQQLFILATLYLTIHGTLPDHGSHECNWFPLSAETCHPETHQVQALEVSWNFSSSDALLLELGMLSQLTSLTVTASPSSVDTMLQSPYLENFLPTHLEALTNLEELRLTQLGLRGSLPSFIGEWANLEVIDFNNNQISGPIPLDTGWQKLTNLVEVVLDGNYLSGTLPSQIGLWSSLEFLNLGKNNFTGPIPSELGVCQNLILLNVNENGFSGIAPAEIGQLENLILLNIKGNEITGEIPEGICELPQDTFSLVANCFEDTLICCDEL